jgi:DNA polymerase-3 subunit beta
MITPTRPLKPVLQNLKISATNERCTLWATDLDTGIRLQVDHAQTLEPGDALLPASRVQAILREMPDEIVSIETNDHTCRLWGSSTEFELPTTDPSEYPDNVAPTSEYQHKVGATLLKELVRRTVFAAALENPRYAVAGTLWEFDGPSIRLVATDGRRLAVAQGQAISNDANTTNSTPNHVVPTKAMHLLQRSLPNPDETIKVGLRANDVLFEMENATIYSLLVEGRYPAYREVFPKKPTTKIQLQTGPFHTAIRQAAVMTDKENLKVSLQFEKKILTLMAQGADAGRSKVEMPIDYDGKAIEIAFDPQFITDYAPCPAA